MTQTSLSQSPNDTTSSQDVIEIKTVTRSVGRKATITKEELFQAALNLIGPQKSIASLSLREVAREAGIAPNSFYRHFKDIDELAISLIDRAGIVLRKIIRQARLRASLQDSIIRSSVEIFLQQLDADEGNLSLLLREGFTGSASYKAAVDRQLNFFQQELQEDLIRLERLNNNHYTTLNLLQKQLHNLFFTWVPK